MGVPMRAQHGGEWSGSGHVSTRAARGRRGQQHRSCIQLTPCSVADEEATARPECAIAGRAQSSCKGPATKTPMVISGSSAIKCQSCGRASFPFMPALTGFARGSNAQVACTCTHLDSKPHPNTPSSSPKLLPSVGFLRRRRRA
jgi:hypothetical protein